MTRRPLTGRESSVLALLARSRGQYHGDDLVRIISTLDGEAKSIAVAISTGQGSRSSKLAARGFTDWADGLEKRRKL